MILEHLGKINNLDLLDVSSFTLPDNEKVIENVIYSLDGTYYAVSQVVSGLQYEVAIYKKADGVYTKIQTLTDTAIAGEFGRLGCSMEFTPLGDTLVVSAHDSRVGAIKAGRVEIWKLNAETGLFELFQKINNPDNPTSHACFGWGFCLLKDNAYLLIFATETAKVYVYKLNEAGTEYTLLKSYATGRGSLALGRDVVNLDDEHIVVSDTSDDTTGSLGVVQIFKLRPDFTLMSLGTIPCPEKSGNRFSVSLRYNRELKLLACLYNTLSGTPTIAMYDWIGGGSFTLIKTVDEGALGIGSIRASSIAPSASGFDIFSDNEQLAAISAPLIKKRGRIELDRLNLVDDTSDSCTVFPVMNNDNLAFIANSETEQVITYNKINCYGERSNTGFGIRTALSLDGQVLYVLNISQANGVGAESIYRYGKLSNGEWYYQCSVSTGYTDNNTVSSITTNADGSILIVPTRNNFLDTDHLSRYSVNKEGFILTDRTALTDIIGFPAVYGFASDISAYADGNRVVVSSIVTSSTTGCHVDLSFVDGSWVINQIIDNVPLRWGIQSAISPDNKRVAFGIPNQGSSPRVDIYNKDANDNWVKVHTIADSTAGFGDSVTFGYASDELFVSGEAMSLKTMRFIQTGGVTEWTKTHTFGSSVNGEQNGFGAQFDTTNGIFITGSRSYESNSVAVGLVVGWELNPAGTAKPVYNVYPPAQTFNSGFGENIIASKDGKHVAVCARVIATGVGAGDVTIYELVDGNYIKIQKLIKPTTNGAVFGFRMAFSGDGKWLYISDFTDSSNAGVVYVYQLAYGEFLYYGLFKTKTTGSISFGASVTSNYDGSVVYVGKIENRSPRAISVERFTRLDNKAEYVAMSTDTILVHVEPENGYHDIAVSADGKVLVLVNGSPAKLFVYLLGREGIYRHAKTISLGTVSGVLHSISVSISDDGKDILTSHVGSTSTHATVNHVHFEENVHTKVKTVLCSYGKTARFEPPVITMASDCKTIAIGLGGSVDDTEFRKDSMTLTPYVIRMPDNDESKPYDGTDSYQTLEGELVLEPIIPVML